MKGESIVKHNKYGIRIVVGKLHNWKEIESRRDADFSNCEIYWPDGGADCRAVSKEENILLKVFSQWQKDRKR